MVVAAAGGLAAAVASGIAFSFPRAMAELFRFPFIILEDKIRESGCIKKPEKETEVAAPLPEPEPSFKHMGPATIMRVTSDENYIDTDWIEIDVAENAFKRVRANLDNPDEYEKIANTCAKLIELYAMKSSRKSELLQIRDRIMLFDPFIAEKIELDKFSQCTFYEGRIMLYR